MIDPTFISRSLTNFWRTSAKIATHLCSVVMEFHNGWENRKMNARINTADELSTSDEHLVSLVQ